jgi:outer membrane biosynthesis protein TonB
VVLVWRGEALEEKVFEEPSPVTIGGTRDDTFAVPASRIGDRFPLFSPSGSGGWVLTLADGMGGKVNVGGEPFVVEEFLRSGRGIPSGVSRQQPLTSSDWGIVSLDPAGDVAFFFQFLTSRVVVPRPRGGDPFLNQALAIAAIVHIALLIIAFIVYEKDDSLEVDPPPSTAIAKLLIEPPEEPKPEEKKPKAEGRKVREDDASKRAAGKEGKIGNPDSKIDKTVIPKGPRDQIAQKVSNMGLLGVLKGQQGKSSNALKSLLSDTPDATLTTAMAGVKGASLQIGHGAGGLSTRGEGPGGGGTGQGQILGVGNLAIGGGGTGARATGTGGGRVAKELKVHVEAQNPDTSGGLSREQILKVVLSHQAAIQFCYEKELQRFPHLSGKVTLEWKVDLDGHVVTVKVGSSSMNNASVEQCMTRQVKAWQFPKPNGVVALVSFPFFFKGN